MAHRFNESEYFSAVALERSRALLGGNLSDPLVLREAVASRSFQRESILFAFDFCSIGDALNLALHLRRAGFEHFLPLSDGAETCAALRRAARSRGVGETPCYWSSWPSSHEGWTRWGSSPSCISALRKQKACVIEQLWASRYAAAATLLAAGANVFHMDTDTVLVSDPYLALKRPPFSKHNFIFLRESPINGGLWYAQETREGEGAQWIIAEVARRTLETISLPLKPRTREKLLPPFDQAMLADTFHSALTGARVVVNMCRSLMRRTGLYDASLLCADSAQGQMRRVRWKVGEAPSVFGGGAGRVPLSAHHGALPSARDRVPPSACGRATDTTYCHAPLQPPGAKGRESAAEAPGWLFPSGWRAQRHGHFGESPPTLGAVHLLGVRCRWCLSSEDPDMGSKWEWQQLAGFWESEAYLSIPGILHAHLPHPADAAATHTAAAHAAASTELIAQKEARETDRVCAKRARLLPRGRPLLLASPRLVVAASEAADGGRAARLLVQRLVSLAAFSGRFAVLPSFNCSAPWIRKCRAGRRCSRQRESEHQKEALSEHQMEVLSEQHGEERSKESASRKESRPQKGEGGALPPSGAYVHDLRVVVTSLSSRASLPLGLQRCSPCNVQVECRRHVLSEAQYARVRELAQRGARPLPAPLGLTLPRRLTLPQLWKLLRSPRRGGAAEALQRAPVLELSSLPELAPTSSTDDVLILGEPPSAISAAVNAMPLAAAPLASMYISSLCGVSSLSRRREREGCPAADDESELSDWREKLAETPHSSRLALRVGEICGDLLCSAEACRARARRECAARLVARNVSDTRAAEACTSWLDSLGRGWGPRCDAWLGKCFSPPIAYPTRVHWPDASCVVQTSTGAPTLCQGGAAAVCRRCVH